MTAKFIVHDVLQTSRLSRRQRKTVLRNGPLHEVFTTNMKPFEGHPVTLACLAEGCEDKQWVARVKAHPEWDVQCHGYTHCRHDLLEPGVLKRQLSQAKARLEKTFGKPVTEFYPPFNKYSDTTQAVAKELGMEEIRRYRLVTRGRKKARRWEKARQVDFHYWWWRDVELAHFVLLHFINRPFYIIGAPRSGTTALMRWMGRTNSPVLCVLKEVEHIWHNDTNIRSYYARKLQEAGKSRVLDKNVRNTHRRQLILGMFPNAEVIHLIRDGRAVANSWRNWARKTNKPDQSIEYAARQWVDYVTEGRKWAGQCDYTEYRYERLCRTDPVFVSRNGKWQKQLTEEEKRIVMEIQGPLLRELGYV